MGELLIRASVDPIPTDPFSLVISDVIQNFRGCLEHLAYALTAAFTKPLPEDVARDSQFPIIGDVDRKGNTGQGATLFQSQSKCVRGMHPAAQLVIEGVQPYHRGNAFRNEPLWKLGALSNTDKHRTLHLAASYSKLFTINPHQIGARTLVYPNAIGKTFRTTGASVERDTVIGSIEFVHSDATHQVELDVTPSMAFSDGVALNDDVIDTLEDIETYLIAFVIPSLSKFL